MTLCLDIGNSQIFGGIFNEDDELIFQFRKSSGIGLSSDEFGLFLRTVLRENRINPEAVNQISMCSVVPNLIYSIKNGCIKYFGIEPFILQAGVKTGLKIKYSNPHEVGSDRIANAVAATNLFPHQNIIVIDLGTATTFDVITKSKEYLGGVIVPGVKISMEVLESKTAKLPIVEIEVPEKVIGKTTKESIQSGLYFGHIGIMKEIIQGITAEAFEDKKAFIIGTGGFSNLFSTSNLFDQIIPDLVLRGLLVSLRLNQGK